MKESKDVSYAEDNVAALQQQLSDLESQFNAETSALAAATDPLTETLDRIMLKPSKSNIAVKLVALVWVPHWRMTDGTSLLPGHSAAPAQGTERARWLPLSRMALFDAGYLW